MFARMIFIGDTIDLHNNRFTIHERALIFPVEK